jgi:hypothetical protein
MFFCYTRYSHVLLLYAVQPCSFGSIKNNLRNTDEAIKQIRSGAISWTEGRKFKRTQQQNKPSEVDSELVNGTRTSRPCLDFLVSEFSYVPALRNCVKIRNALLNYGQQDATFLEFIYFYRRCTCFRRFLHPTSGAHNCTKSFRYCQPILLPAATVGKVDILSLPR